MVTGGFDHDGSLDPLSSTEIYVQSAWSYVASLPSPRDSLSATTVDNSVFVFGKNFKFSSQTELVIVCITGGYYFNGSSNYFDEILRYDPASDTWTAVGRMKTPRYSYSVMSLGNITGLC